MADIKLVALDLDGTLFNSNGKITEKTREEINKKKTQTLEKNIQVCYTCKAKYYQGSAQ